MKESLQNILNYAEKVRKIRRNRGKEYIIKNGKVVTGRVCI